MVKKYYRQTLILEDLKKRIMSTMINHNTGIGGCGPPTSAGPTTINLALFTLLMLLYWYKS